MIAKVFDPKMIFGLCVVQKAFLTCWRTAQRAFFAENYTTFASKVFEHFFEKTFLSLRTLLTNKTPDEARVANLDNLWRHEKLI